MHANMKGLDFFFIALQGVGQSDLKKHMVDYRNYKCREEQTGKIQADRTMTRTGTCDHQAKKGGCAKNKQRWGFWSKLQNI